MYSFAIFCGSYIFVKKRKEKCKKRKKFLQRPLFLERVPARPGGLSRLAC
jgi:hypothetical protein